MEDGRIARFEVPEGTTPEQAQTMMQAHFAGEQPKPPMLQVPMSRTDKVIKGMADPIEGGAQLLTRMLPQGVVDAGNSFNNWLADKTGLVAKLPERNLSSTITGQKTGLDGLIQQNEAEYQAKRAAAGETGFDGYRTIGNVLSPANMAIAAKLPAAATTLGKVGVGAAGGAASAALSPVAEGDYWKQKAEQTALGAVGGGAVPVLSKAVSRVISPNASVNPQLQLLKQEGVKPTIGQTLGGFANRIEEKAQSLPIVGDAISYARNKATSEFERAANNRALAPIGEKLPEGIAGREAVAYTETVLKNKYDEVLNKIGAIGTDTKFNQGLQSLDAMVNKLMIPKADKLKFKAALNDVKSSIDQNGVITSDIYKSLESTLGSDAATLARSQAINDNKIAPAVKQLQAELKELLQRQAGSSADELKAANTGWANFKRVQRAAASVGAEDGNFTPAQFQNAVKALDKSKEKGAFARGNALGQDLGDAGKTILNNKVPNSGTTDRILWGGGALTGAYLANPMLPAGLLGGAAMYSSPAQWLLRGAVSARPQGAKAVANSFEQASPLLIPSGAQIGLGLLN